MKQCNFSLQHYVDSLKLATRKGYSFRTMEEFNKQHRELVEKKQKIVVLRHDIDFDPELALAVAQTEEELGIKSTYFIRIHAKYYSPFSFNTYGVIKKIMKMGHEIGLHFDAGFAEHFNDNPKEMLLRDKEILEKIIGRPLTGISTHEPSRTGFVLSKNLLMKYGFEYDAYSDIFLNDMKYISDSGCRWREGCMCEFIEKDIHLLCILVHPFWWFKRSSLENY